MNKFNRLLVPSVLVGRIAGIACMSLAFFMATGAANIAAGRDFEHGAVMIAVGGGSIEEAYFQTGVYGDATFSFFVGLDNAGNLRGSLFFKRVFDGGARAVISTEITDVQVVVDECTWIHVEGKAGFKISWGTNRNPFNENHANHTFIFEAWDCDNGPDQIWFELARPNNGTTRPGMSLEGPADVTGGHVMVPLPVDFP